MADEVEEKHRQMLKELAHFLDETLNGPKGSKRKTGFVLFMFDFDQEGDEGPFGRMNYMSNAKREDILKCLKDFIPHLEKNLYN
jgi:hypothetical protein